MVRQGLCGSVIEVTDRRLSSWIALRRIECREVVYRVYQRLLSARLVLRHFAPSQHRCNVHSMLARSQPVLSLIRLDAARSSLCLAQISCHWPLLPSVTNIYFVSFTLTHTYTIHTHPHTNIPSSITCGTQRLVPDITHDHKHTPF